MFLMTMVRQIQENKQAMIGGVILLVVGIAFVIIVYEMHTNIDNVVPQVAQGYERCNSRLGHLASAIFGSIAERCAQVDQAPIIIEALQIMIVTFEGIAVFGIVTGSVLILHDKRMEDVY